MQQVIHLAQPRHQIAEVVRLGLMLQRLMLVLRGVEAMSLVARREVVLLAEQPITVMVSHSSRNQNFPVWRGMR